MQKVKAIHAQLQALRNGLLNMYDVRNVGFDYFALIYLQEELMRVFFSNKEDGYTRHKELFFK
jgi:hypothetical protein